MGGQLEIYKCPMCWREKSTEAEMLFHMKAHFDNASTDEELIERMAIVGMDVKDFIVRDYE